ncbi:MAG: efflux RND transporter periplasmic adaptor subunit [Myxococcales bacterium]|nr:efflux RND transporter periplasmic adaptor subunit [Myxococcales bacterium]MDD9967573.1 efflux RND transporter periplasmic adaptor subunit [Myxococcales bacterium]
MMMSLNKTLIVLLTSAVGASGLLTLGGASPAAAPTTHRKVGRAADETPPSVKPQAGKTAAGSGPAEEGPATEGAAEVHRPGTFVGVILPEHATDVAAPQTGVVEDVHVTLGQVVEQDQLLASLSIEQATLDHVRAKAEQAAARAALSRARIEQNHAVEQAERSERLVEEGLATRDELLKARFQLDASRVLSSEAQARLHERRARADQLAAVARDARVTARFAGRVAARYVDAGALVSAGTPLLRLISDAATVLRFAIPEDMAGVARGRRVTVVPSEHPEHAFVATVVRLSPEIDSASRMRTVEAAPVDPAWVTERGLVGAMAKVRFLDDGLAQEMRLDARSDAQEDALVELQPKGAKR